MKKTILFIADKPDWAYEFMIKAWLPFLQKDYDCFVAYDDDYNVKKNNSRSKIFQFIFNIKSLLKFFVKKRVRHSGFLKRLFLTASIFTASKDYKMG